MSDVFRRLGDDIPMPEATGDAGFPRDPKKARAWVSALPRANIAQTQAPLAEALAAAGRPGIEGATRLGVVEALRGPVHDLMLHLERQLAGSAFPLTPEREALARQALDLQCALAHAYRRAAWELCAPGGTVGLLKGGTVAEALERAAFHYARVLCLAWHVYRAHPAGTWQGLHRVAAFAEQVKLADKAVDDPLAAGGKAGVRALHLQALAAAATNPYAFDQAEQVQLWTLSGLYAGGMKLVDGEPAGAIPVPFDADRGPAFGPADEDGGRRALDIAPLRAALEAALARPGAELAFGAAKGVNVTLSVDTAERIRRGFGNAAARGHDRMDAGHRIDTVLGLSGLHFHLAGGRDFDAFLRGARIEVMDRAAWAHGAPGTVAVPTVEAEVLDQSLGGYRLLWDGETGLRARVGELAGLGVPAGAEVRHWMVGMVRWLRHEEDGAVMAGVELLARRAEAVAMRAVGTGGQSRAPLRAIELDPVESQLHGSGHLFLAPDMLDAKAARFEVVRDAGLDAEHLDELAGEQIAATLEGVEVVLNAGDYLLVREKAVRP